MTIESYPELRIPFAVGQGFTRQVRFDRPMIRAFAGMIGDDNPLHHDETAARHSRFGDLIASGTLSSSVLAGLVATAFCALRPSLGLGFSFQFLQAVLADRTMRADWHVTAVDAVTKLRGDVVICSGTLTSDTGDVLVRGEVTTLALWADDDP